MVTGVILAGGRNSRMHGYNKALLPFKGERIIERQVRSMRTICEEIIIVTSEPTVYTDLSLGEISYLPDVYASHGPLTGIHAAFLKVMTDYAWVIGCDYPTLSFTAAEWMVDRLRQSDYDAVIPVIGGKHQMLHGVYRPQAVLSSIIRMMDDHHYRLSGLLDMIRWLGLEESDWDVHGIPLDFAMDVDTPEQYWAMLKDGD